MSRTGSRSATVPAVSARVVGTAGLLCLALVGCTDDDPTASSTALPSPTASATGSAAPSATGGGTSASATAPVATPPPTEPTSAGDATLGPLAEPSEESTADRSVAPPADVVTITAVTVTALDGAEQITITSTGGVPGWSVRYVDAVRIDGEPVLTEGDAALEIVLQAADPNGAQGLSPEVAGTLLPEQPLVREVTMARYLGDTVVFAAGLSARVPFSVATTDTSITITLVA